MKTRLTHLPVNKQDELAYVVDVIRSGFARAIRNRTAEHLRDGKVLKIILFGSYARGGWIEDSKGNYHSDYDILIVVSHDALTEVVAFWGEVENELLAAQAEGNRLRTLVNPIYHALDELNRQLGDGNYFFTEIIHDGILLFDDGGDLVTPKTLAEA